MAAAFRGVVVSITVLITTYICGRSVSADEGECVREFDAINS